MMESKVKQLLSECGYAFYTTVGIGLRAQKREDLTDIREPFFGSWVYPSGSSFGPYSYQRCLFAYAGNRYTADDLIAKFGEEEVLQAIQSANV